LWPEVPERLWSTIKHLSDERINKVTHGNATRRVTSGDLMRMFTHHAQAGN
jgi:hypothetical protein